MNFAQFVKLVLSNSCCMKTKHLKKVWFHERFLFLDRMTGIILNSDCYWQVVRVMLCTIFDCRCNVIQGWYLKSLPYFFLGIQFIFILFAKHSNMDCSVLCLSTFSRYFMLQNLLLHKNASMNVKLFRPCQIYSNCNNIPTLIFH